MPALNDATWTNPTPEEARVEATRIFTELAAESSPLSAVEKARAVNFLGVICFHLADYDCATRYFEAAADASHKVGQRRDELQTLQNLAVTANDLGNYASAARYFDRVVPTDGPGTPTRARTRSTCRTPAWPTPTSATRRKPSRFSCRLWTRRVKQSRPSTWGA